MFPIPSPSFFICPLNTFFCLQKLFSYRKVDFSVPGYRMFLKWLISGFVFLKISFFPQITINFFDKWDLCLSLKTTFQGITYSLLNWPNARLSTSWQFVAIFVWFLQPYKTLFPKCDYIHESLGNLN